MKMKPCYVLRYLKSPPPPEVRVRHKASMTDLKLQFLVAVSAVGRENGNKEREGNWRDPIQSLLRFHSLLYYTSSDFLRKCTLKHFATASFQIPTPIHYSSLRFQSILRPMSHADSRPLAI